MAQQVAALHVPTHIAGFDKSAQPLLNDLAQDDVRLVDFPNSVAFQEPEQQQLTALFGFFQGTGDDSSRFSIFKRLSHSYVISFRRKKVDSAMITGTCRQGGSGATFSCLMEFNPDGND